MSYTEINSFVGSIRDLGLSFYTGISPSDVDLFAQYGAPKQAVVPGRLVDYFGMLVQLKYLKLGQEYEKALSDPPFPSDGFHAEAIEYAGVLRAFHSAKDSFVGVELGCGWAPWIGLAGVLCKRHGKPCQLVGVEGSTEFCAYALEHLSENGLAGDSRIRHAVVGIDKQPKFFKSDTAARNDWGARPAKEAQDGYTRVECITLEEAVADYSLVDFVHFDLQGAELEIFQDQSSRDTARMKAKRLVIGTHSRLIEANLLELLKSDGWILEGEKPCRFNYRPDLEYTDMTYIDGCQLWRNPKLCPS